MKGFARTVLSVEEKSIRSKFQDILRIVKQSGEYGLLKTIAILTRPTLAATLPARPESAKTASFTRDAPCPKQARRREITGGVLAGVCETFDDTHDGAIRKYFRRMLKSPSSKAAPRKHRRRNFSHPPTPRCQDSVFSEWATLRMLSRGERSMGKGGSRRAGVGRVRRADFSASC